MKHASAASLLPLAGLLAALRALQATPALVERRPGCFYRRGQAFLHFHEDPGGLFADVRLQGIAFSRWRVSDPAEQAALLARVRQALEAAGA